MDDRTRISDADREHIAERLREHFAEGRLSSEELDERITATLGAKTYADLRAVVADLPEPAPVPPQPSWPTPPRAGRPALAFRRRPRILPLVLIALIAALVIPGPAGWIFFAFLKVVLLIWLITCVAGIFAVTRFRRNMRRYWQSGYGSRWPHYEWRR
jgi:hypothetical protein